MPTAAVLPKFMWRRMRYSDRLVGAKVRSTVGHITPIALRHAIAGLCIAERNTTQSVAPDRRDAVDQIHRTDVALMLALSTSHSVRIGG